MSNPYAQGVRPTMFAQARKGARFRRARLLIIGCGDVGQRVLQLLPVRTRAVQVLALTSTPHKAPMLRALGAQPLVGDLDGAASLRRLAGVAQYVLHLAPPPGQGTVDTRTQALLRALGRGRAPRALVYVSTTGVYGDAAGAWVDENRPLAPRSARALRRVDAERQVRRFGLRRGTRTALLRAPGIYAPDRVGGTPRARLEKGQPVLRAQDDVFTNHIHADDLARACWLALWRARPQRALNVCDDSALRMGDYFDQAADLYGLPRPLRVSWAQAEAMLTPMQLSFMRESRRLRNARLKHELRLRLRWPDVLQGLAAGVGTASAPQG
jgi:nucleoside-diphosphate-sugar epimerase